MSGDRTAQKKIENWTPEMQRIYWMGFDEGCKLTFEFTGTKDNWAAKRKTFIYCGPQHGEDYGVIQ